MDGSNQKSGIVNRSAATAAAVAAAAAAIIVLISLPQISGSGSFQVFLTSYLNDEGLNANGSCCAGSRRSGSCSSGCRTLFRVCLSHFQSSSSSSSSYSSSSSSSSSSSCSFGSKTTPVLGENSFKVSEVPDSSFVNPVDLPFVFTWPGSFSLTIEAWHNNDLSLMTPHSDPENKSQSLISRLSFQQYLNPGVEWQQQQRMRRSNETGVRFRFRVVCSTDYYGTGCSEICRPRNDVFGHYNCSDNGTKVCLDGWKGDYCNTAMCLPGCHETHGVCEEPNQCKCRLGWKGARCDECIAHPGCVHGSCVEPFNCNCDHGWGGILCDQDLDFCARRRPCLNGATCINAGQEGFTCLCPTGATGANCETDTDDCRAEHLSCLNNGRCLVVDGGSDVHKCHCTPDFYGRRCEVSSTLLPFALRPGHVTCSDRPCLNGGACASSLPVVGSLSPGYTCTCLQGYSGRNCEYQTDHCLSRPCLNGGRCIFDPNGFRCFCQPGYDGIQCQIHRSLCSGNPCQHSGSCVDDDESAGFRCLCHPDFTGRLCHLPVSSSSSSRSGCSPSTCGPGATTCLELSRRFLRCVCVEGFAGRYCNETAAENTGPPDEEYSVTPPPPPSPPAVVLLLQQQLTLLAVSLGTLLPFALLTTLGVLCLVTAVRRRRRKSSERIDVDDRCLNNQSSSVLLPLETVSLKTVAGEQQRTLLLNPDRDKKNFLLEAENERRGRKSNNTECNNSVKDV